MSARLVRRKPLSARRKDGLLAYACNKHSQGGEDGILNKIFAEILPPEAADHGGGETERWCVDVGAWDGVHLSNTRNLLSQETDDTVGCWKGCLIEANPERITSAEKLYAEEGRPQICVSSTIGLDGEHSLTETLRKHAPGLPASSANGRSGFCFLSIDVDSYDYWIWDGLKDYKPAVVCIEFNPTIPNHILFVQARDESVRQGSSLAALEELAVSLGYRLIETTLYNAFFVLENLWEQFRPHLPGAEEDIELTIDILHEPPSMGTDLWQLYDGNLCIAGCKKLLWHRVPMDVEKMQVLAKEKRGTFPFAPPSKTHTKNRDAKQHNSKVKGKPT